MLGLPDKDIKTGVISVFCMFKKLSRVIEAMRKTQNELIEMRNTMFEMKNTLNRINDNLDVAEEKISKLKDTTVEIIISKKKHREKNLKMN